jgi:hypothetical protein
MKILLSVFIFGLLICFVFACFRFLGAFANIPNPDANPNPMQEDCLTEENFEKAFHYIQWKYKTSKKLSENSKVIFDDGYELDVMEQENIGRRITFSKEGYKGFSVDMREKYIPHTKIAQYQKYFCKLVKTATLVNLPKNYMYKYIDGNNNVWIINAEDVEYKPIAKENSSSSEYSGGEPFKKNTTLAQYQAIQLLLKKGLSNKSIQLANRNMGCGTVLEFVAENVVANECYLAMNSDEKQATEEWLKQLKE